MTSRYDRSFEIRLSVSKSPPSSESRLTREANDCAVGCAMPYSPPEITAATRTAELAAYRMAGLIGCRNRIIVPYSIRHWHLAGPALRRSGDDSLAAAARDPCRRGDRAADRRGARRRAPRHGQ